MSRFTDSDNGLIQELKTDICTIGDIMKQKEINGIHWVSMDMQLADCLTKFGASSQKLLDVLCGKVALPFSQ